MKINGNTKMKLYRVDMKHVSKGCMGGVRK